MANMIREKIEQKFGPRIEQIEKQLEKSLETALGNTIETTQKILATPAGAKAQAAAISAKQNLDQILLGLEHKGYNLKEPQDLIQTVGRKVLERASEIAEDVRSQVAAKPYSPTWLKDLKIPKVGFAETSASPSAAAAGATEAEVGEQLESQEDSPEERAAGTVLTANPAVESTSVAEASKSTKASKAPKASKKAPNAAL